MCRKDSQEISLKDRQTILHECMHSNTNYIIITHGTDTLIETGKYLHNVLFDTKNQSNLKIILTGAMRPEKFRNTDAHFNIGMAISSVQMVKPGVYIVMNGRVVQAINAVRNAQNGLFLNGLEQLQLAAKL